MFKKSIIALAATAAIGAASISTEASARPGGRGGYSHGGGFHGGGFHGGGFHGGGRGYRGGYGGRGVGLGIGLGLLGAAGAYGAYNAYNGGYGYGYAPTYGNGCIQPRRIWTAYGYQVRNVDVCAY